MELGAQGDRFGLYSGVDAGHILRAQRAAVMDDPQALGQQQLQFVAESLPPGGPSARGGLVLEELLPREVLEVRIKASAKTALS